MSGIFDVTSAEDHVQLNADGKGEATFTVTNGSSGSIRAQIRLRPLEETKSEWLNLAGETDHDFAPGGTQQVVVKVQAPAATPAGKYSFRIDVIPVDNPDEDYSEGPAVTLRIGLPPKPARPFPWLALVAVSAGLVTMSGLVYLIIPKKVDVPKVTNMRFADAEKVIRDAGLTVERVVREDAGGDDEKIIDQDPKEGKIKKGGIIKVIVAVPVKFDVPNLTGKSFEEASREIAGMGLIAEKIVEEYPGVQEELVVDQEPKEGKIKKGGVIKLTVMVPMPPFRLPDFVGAAKSIKEAEEFFSKRFVFVTKVPVENDNEREGNILAQRPDKNEEVKAGDMVTLTFAVPTTQFTMPKMIGRPWETAVTELENKGLKVELKGKVDPGQEHEQIIEQEPPPGRSIRSGEKVILTAALTVVNVPAVVGLTLEDSRTLLKEAGLALYEVRGDCTHPIEDSDPKPDTGVPKSIAVTLYTPGDREKVCRKEFLLWSQAVKTLILPQLLDQ